MKKKKNNLPLLNLPAKNEFSFILSDRITGQNYVIKYNFDGNIQIFK